jgi:hypothetical protein
MSAGRNQGLRSHPLPTNAPDQKKKYKIDLERELFSGPTIKITAYLWQRICGPCL